MCDKQPKQAASKSANPRPAWVNPIWAQDMESRRRDALRARERMMRELGRVFI